MQEKFANVGLNYSDNFFGNMVFHTLFVTKDGKEAFRTHTYDSVQSINKPVDNDLMRKDPNVAELPKIKVLESSSLVDENDNYYLAYEIPYGTRSLSPEKDSSFNDKSLPENNEIMRHYI